MDNMVKIIIKSNVELVKANRVLMEDTLKEIRKHDESVLREMENHYSNTDRNIERLGYQIAELQARGFWLKVKKLFRRRDVECGL